MAYWWLGGVVFAVLATANSGGYRFGTSDHAYYVPAVVHALDPTVFPRDGALLDVQGRFIVLDEFLAGVMRRTGMATETLFFAGYLLTVALLWTGLVLVGTHVYATPWALAALASAETLRHRISRTSANSIEPYFLPRMLAFSVGVVAIAMLLRRRRWLSVFLVAIVAVIHITTGVWFAVLVGTALAVLDTRLRRLAVWGSMAVVLIGIWALITGRLGAPLARMDEVWLEAVASKDSLFASDWPLWAWAANLGLLPLLVAVHHRRLREGSARREDGALVWGAAMLVALFLFTLPLVEWQLTLPVQLQISRVFWLVDFVALIYLIAFVTDHPATVPNLDPSAPVEGRRRAPSLTWATRRGPVVAAVLVTVSLGRGAYVMLEEHPDRALFAVHVPDSPWEDAMRWVARQPADRHVLADPDHAWKYGTSVRVTGRHDVFLEGVKDAALAIYSREVAGRVVERSAALGDFAALTTERAEDLARRYDLDYLVTEADLPLPIAYRNAQFSIYTLGGLRLAP